MEAICYLTNKKNTSEMERRYNLLPEDNYFKKYVFSDIKENLFFSENINHFSFSFDDLCKGENFSIYTHMSLFSFYKENPDFEYYWLIEDDVLFNGDWGIFFNFYKNLTADIVSPKNSIERLPNAEKKIDVEITSPWLLAPLNRIKGTYYTNTPIAGGLSVILRLSNRLLKTLVELYDKQKVYGHLESFIYTVCAFEKYSSYSLVEDRFCELQYCNCDTGYRLEDFINIPENILVHAVKF